MKLFCMMYEMSMLYRYISCAEVMINRNLGTSFLVNRFELALLSRRSHDAQDLVAEPGYLVWDMQGW